MTHPDLDAAVDAALDRIGAMLGAAAGEEAAGIIEQPGLAFAGLDVQAGEVLEIAHRVVRSYLDHIEFGRDVQATAQGIRGAFLTGYLVGRLHEPHPPAPAPNERAERYHEEIGRLHRHIDAAWDAHCENRRADLQGALIEARWGS